VCSFQWLWRYSQLFSGTFQPNESCRGNRIQFIEFQLRGYQVLFERHRLDCDKIEDLMVEAATDISESATLNFKIGPLKDENHRDAI
jgi:hypothetical protein